MNKDKDVQPFKRLNLYDMPACDGCAHWGMPRAAGARCLRNEGGVSLLARFSNPLATMLHGSWRTWLQVSLSLLVLSDRPSLKAAIDDYYG